MKRQILTALAVLALALPVAAQDVASGTWSRDIDGSMNHSRMTQQGTFTNVGAGAVAEQSFALGVQQAKLAQIIVTSTTAAADDIDVAVYADTGTGATELAYWNDDITSTTTTPAAGTVNEVTYTLYLNELVDSPVITDASEYVWVKVLNNDAAVRTVTVRLFWESE